MPKRSSSVAGREFGRGIRAVIARTGLTHRRLAQLLGWQEQKISDLVTGKGGCDEWEVRELLAYCRATVVEREHLVALFRVSGEAWLQVHRPGTPLPQVLRTLLELEKLASKVVKWSLNLIPSQLQVPGYMRAVAVADSSVADTVVEDYVSARIERRATLSGREFVYYLHEHALRLRVGGRDVMAEQLHHLLRMAVRPNITLRIMPFEAGAHPGMACSFSLFEFPNAPTAVLPEGSLQSLWLDQPDSVATYQATIDALAQHTLSERESLALLTTIAEEMAS